MHTAINRRLRVEAVILVVGMVLTALLGLAYFLLTVVPAWRDYGHRNVTLRNYNQQSSALAEWMP